MQPWVSGLFVHPLKSCAAVAVDRWPMDPMGLRHDRSYLVVTTEGRFVTQREFPALALVRPTLTARGWDVRVADRGTFRLPFRLSGAPDRVVMVWDHTGPARDAGPEAAALLSDHLGTAVRLAGLADDHTRRSDPGFGTDAPVGFADGFPLLVTADSSLADLNGRMARPLPMRRFRPNIVVAGSPPWAEDGWRRLAIGATEVDLVKPCARCTITTVDPDLGERDGAEPLRTLGTFRRGDRGVRFGQNAAPVVPGEIAVGDPVIPAGPATAGQP